MPADQKRTGSLAKRRRKPRDQQKPEPKEEIRHLPVGAGTLEPTPPVEYTPQIANQIEQFAALYPFPLDQFQRDAVATLLKNESVMVAAPTGTGKTVVAEFGIYHAMRGTGRVFYTTPIKALSNQKYRDLHQVYGDQVGLLTGDVSENRDAQVLVMTTEILRNMLLQTPWELDTVDWVIFDEIHYLADQERGTTWEEAIILCPDHVQLICLSATVSNAHEIADWIGRTHRPIRLVTHVQRSVPLSLSYFVDGKLTEVVDHQGILVRDFPHTGGEARKQVGRGARFRRGDRDDPGIDEPQPHEVIDSLAARDFLPAIYFLFSRNECQAQAERLAALRPHLVTPEQSQRIEALTETLLAQLRPEDRELEQVQVITGLVKRGVAFHHAGLLPILKQLVEVLFTQGLLQVVFATDTLALGVNMPARSVVVGRMTKWDGRRRRPLLPNEFQQMAGRAGRRGMDAAGQVIVPYSPWITFNETRQIATGPLEPVRSAFAIRYNTVLNLWDPPSGDRVRHLIHQSLARYQSNQRIRQLESDIVEISGDLTGVPSGCLIGLDAGEELLDEFNQLSESLVVARQRRHRIERELAELDSLANKAAWPIPTGQSVRRWFKEAEPGQVAHHREHGWAVNLGESRAGYNRFLFTDGQTRVVHAREIDYLTDLARIDVAADSAEEWQAELTGLALPDLETMAAEHRLRENELNREERERLGQDLFETDQDIERITLALEKHPCHDCPVRPQHEAYRQRAAALSAEKQVLQEILQAESEAEEARVRGVLGGIREVLHRFGYLHRGFPSAKADMLALVFDNDGLILCELIDRGLFDNLEPEDLAEVFSWYSFDRDFRYGNRFTLPDHLMRLGERIEDVEKVILGEERDARLYVSEGHNGTFYGAARAWCQGASMTEIVNQIELSEGDMVLTFNKTLDLMRQVREMLEEVRPESPLVRKFRQAENLMLRDIVEQSLAIGFAPVDFAEALPLTPESEIATEEPPKAKRKRKQVTV